MTGEADRRGAAPSGKITSLEDGAVYYGALMLVMLKMFPELGAPPFHSPTKSIIDNRWDEKAGLRRDAVRSQVIDVL